MESDLHQRAREAYERGRLRQARVWALPGVLLAAFLLSRGYQVTALFALIAAAGSVFAAWRGQYAKRALPLGTIGGLLAASVPLYLSCGPDCASTCDVTCLLATAGTGGVTGLVLASSPERPRALAALGIASLYGLSGCLALGVGGLVGVVAGALIAVPVWVVRPTIRA